MFKKVFVLLITICFFILLSTKVIKIQQRLLSSRALFLGCRSQRCLNSSFSYLKFFLWQSAQTYTFILKTQTFFFLLFFFITHIHRTQVLFLNYLLQELHADIQSHFLPDMLGTMLQALRRHMDSASLEDVTHGLRACFKVLSKIQMPVAYMDAEAGAQTEEAELPSPEEEKAKVQIELHFIDEFSSA